MYRSIVSNVHTQQGKLKEYVTNNTENTSLQYYDFT